MISEERMDRMGMPPLAKARMLEAYTLRISFTGKWRLPTTGNGRADEDIKIYGATIEAMVALSTVEHGGQIGKWRLT